MSDDGLHLVTRPNAKARTKDYATSLAMLKKQIKHACIHDKPVSIPNSREVIIERISKLFSALRLEVSRDGWNVQNYRLLNHISSVVGQLPDDDDAEALEDELNSYMC